eukprot:946185-Pleurochrysis_carterae.AAC.2
MGPRPGRGDEAHTARRGAPRSAGAGRPADQGACGPQPEGRQGAAGAAGPALPLQGAQGDERGLSGARLNRKFFDVLEADDDYTSTSPTAPSQFRPSALPSCCPVATPTAI